MEVGPALNAFAFKLMKQLTTEEPGKNILCSPYSISSAMSMVLLGADGVTKTELEKALLISDGSNVHKRMELMQDSLNGSELAESLHTANKLFLEKSFLVKTEFTSSLLKHYKSTTVLEDFKGNPEASRNNINKWVSEETHGKIKDLMPPNSVRSDTRLVLANAIYFKGKWESQFSKSRTIAQDFHICQGQTVKVDMMMKKAKYPLAMDRNGRLKMIEMPYQGLPVSMLIVLPTGELQEIEQSLDAPMLAELISSLGKEEVVLGVPKFELEFEKDLCDSFRQFGANSIFLHSANLRGISDSEGLAVAAIAHKAYICVDEEGTEAAAATGVAMEVMEWCPTMEFICNKPFIFILYHKPTKAILFTGRMLNPSL